MDTKMQKNFLITITGPSLTGKTTLAGFLKEHDIQELVSTTTRGPRSGEVDGVAYHFTNNDKFEEALNNDRLIEHIKLEKATKTSDERNNYYYYGISKDSLHKILDNGQNACIVVEPHGAEQVADYCNSQGIPIFKVFINNPQQILFTRYVERLLNDKEATVEAYSNRLHHMVNVEPKKWIEPAYNGKEQYDVVFDQFSKENTKEVISKILDGVQKKFANEENVESKKQTRLRF
jgi:guanylate kinase